MNDFRFCYPDANNFDKVIKIKPVDQWNAEYTSLDYGIGYWTTELPFDPEHLDTFKNLIKSFPIQKDNNHPDNFDPNPFDTIHVPEWVSKNICFLIRDFYIKNIRQDVFDPQIHEWGNVYFKERARPISCWRIPHIDYAYGLVANMWFTDHDVADSSTKLYKYHGEIKDYVYDFQVDTTHKMFEEWRAIAEKPTRADAWFNMSDEDLARWGFEIVGSIPNKVGTMTMYKANVCHLASISKNVGFRWSHAFAFSHEVLKNKTMRDLFR